MSDYAGLSMTPPEKLRLFLDREGLDVVDLARETGLGYNHVAQMVRGARRFTPRFYQRAGRFIRQRGVEDERDILGPDV